MPPRTGGRAIPRTVDEVYERLGRWCFRNPWRVISTWVAALAVVIFLVVTIGPAFDSELEIPDSESRDGFDILEERFNGFGSGLNGTIVFRAEQGVTDSAVAASMQQLFDEVATLDGVLVVLSPYAPDGERFIAAAGEEAGRIAYATVELEPGVDEIEAREVVAGIDDAREEFGIDRIDGLRVELGGETFAELEPPESEALGLAFAVFVLIVAMGSVIAMGTTIAVAVFGVGMGVLTASLLSNLITIPEFATTLGLMVGLGVGIDYALFIINRYREGLRAGHSPEDATALAMDTAGRSVIFAGVTVVVSLLGLLLIGLAFVAGLGITAATTVAMVMLASATLLPASLGLMRDRAETTKWRGVLAAGFIALALLGLGLGFPPLMVAGAALAVLVLVIGFLPFGARTNPLQRELAPRPQPELRDTWWYRLSRTVQAHPWIYAIGGIALLLFLSLPVFGLRFGFSDTGNFPEETTTRQAYDLLADGFGPGANGPFLIATEIDSADEASALFPLTEALNADPGVAFASPPLPSVDGLAAIIQVQPTTSPQDKATADLIDTLRADLIPEAIAGSGLEPKVTGIVAASNDFSEYLGGRTLVFFAAVLGLSFLLLMAVFRSVLVPLKAVIMNMLSIGAAYGIVVAIFQWGWLGGIFGVEPAPVEPFIPMMLFAVLFGLSMDYELFLLSRIKEEFERTGDPVNSVADGLAATARVITAAAAIMVVVFGSFVFEDVRVIKLFGMGLASAILIDASIVRMLIVPSTMELLGKRNWWLPGWLDRILPNLNVEGTLKLEGTGQAEAH